MNENRNEYFTGVLLVIVGILSTALFIDGFYFNSAIFNVFSRGFSRWAENLFGIFSIMMFSIPTIAGIVLIMGEKSLNHIFMLLGYVLLALLIPPFFHKISGNNYNAGTYGMKVSQLFSGSGSTAIEAAIYFLWLGLSAGFLLFPIRGKIVEGIAKLMHVQTNSADVFDNSSKRECKAFSFNASSDSKEKSDKVAKKSGGFNINKLFAKNDAQNAGINHEPHNNPADEDIFIPQKSSSFKVTQRVTSDDKEILKPQKKSIFQVDPEVEAEIKNEAPKKKASIFEVIQQNQSNKSSETIPWVSKVIYESEDKRMEVPIFSKAPIKKFTMKKNDENVEEYTQVDTLSGNVYNKVAAGSENIKIDIDSHSYFEKVKDNWPESWKNNPNDRQAEEYSDEIPECLEEVTEDETTTEEEMINEAPQEIEKARIVSDFDNEELVTLDNHQTYSFLNRNPFDFSDDDDDSFYHEEILDEDIEAVEDTKQEQNADIFLDDDWDFRKARKMDEAFNSGEYRKPPFSAEKKPSFNNRFDDENRFDTGNENHFTDNRFNISNNQFADDYHNNDNHYTYHNDIDDEEIECAQELQPDDDHVWKNSSENIDSGDIKKFLHQNMESYSRFKENEKEIKSRESNSYFPNESANQRNEGLYQRSVQFSKLPNDNLLKENKQHVNPEEYKRAEAEAATILENTLAEFGIKAKVCDIIHGPVVTLFKIIPAPGIKLSKIEGLSDNLALRLAAQSIRIIAPIPGEKVVGIEVPNPKRELISFKEVINSESFTNNSYQVPVGLGKDIYGKVITIDVHRMPHILIAGATGAGKSVCVNGFLCSILFSRSPEDVKMILIDPKVVELQPYDGIPHLLTPVITDPKDAVNALKYLVYEMEERYKILGKIGVRSIVEYRKMVKEGKLSMSIMPFIVCVVDEFADLMTTVGKEAEMLFARLTAKARAVGIHLVLATQRPSADVITGVIKSNVPARIAFQVISYQDSRIILDQKGAEKLLGQGDMLYLSPTQPHPVRLQGAFLDKEEVDLVVEHWKSLGEPDYIDIADILGLEDEESGISGSAGGTDGASGDPLYDEAVEIVLQTKKASASYLQRRLSIGYNRAARLIEEMEFKGIVGPMQGSKPREVFGSAANAANDDNENYF